MDENEKKTEKLAGKENKDVQSAAYDKNQNKLLDFDDLMQEDNDVVKRLKNLFKFGVTEEQVRNIYNMSSDISIGGSKEEAFKNLEKVFIALAIKITNYPNGIVIDLKTGEIDEVLSKNQCRELNIPYEKIEAITQSNNINQMAEIVASIKINDIKNASILSDFNDIKDTFDAIGDYYNDKEAIRRRNIALGITEVESDEINNLMRYGLVNAKEDREIIFDMFRYKYLENAGASQEELDKAEKKINENVESKYYKEYINEYGSLDLSHLGEFLEKWNAIHSAALLEQNFDHFFMEFEKEPIPFNKLDNPEQKKKIVKILARGFVSDVSATHKSFLKACQMLNVKPDFESIKELAATIGIEVNSIDDIKEKFKKEVTIDNYEEEISKIVLGSEYENERESAGKTVMINSKRKELVYKALNKSFDDREKMGEASDNALILMELFRKYAKEKDYKNKNIINNYMRQMSPYIEEYLKTSGLSDDSIFREDGDVSIKKVENILKNVTFSKSTQKAIDNLENDITVINEYLEEVRESEQPKINKIKESVENLNKNAFDIESEEEIIKQLGELSVGAVSSKMIEDLKKLDSKRINDVLQSKFTKEQNVTVSEIFKVNRETSSYKEKMIFNLFNEGFGEKRPSEDNRALQVISIYKHYYEKSDKQTCNILKAYIKDEAEYFERYFQTKGLKENTIFNMNGTVSIDKIFKILENLDIGKESNRLVELFIKEIDKSNSRFAGLREINEKKLQDLNTQLNFLKDENAILGLLDTMNTQALDTYEINKLKELHSDRIDQKLKEKLGKDKVAESIFLRENKKNEDIKKRENVLLMEAKLEMAKGTTKYTSTLEARSEFYKNNPEYREIAEKMRDKKGNLKDGWKKEVNKYTNELVDKVITHSIKKIDPLELEGDEKKRYATLLLLGLGSKDTEVKQKSMQTLKVLYSRFFDFKDAIKPSDISRTVYTLEYEENLTEEELDEKIEVMRKNLATRLVRNKEPEKERVSLQDELKMIEKVTDSDFPFEEMAEELITEVDLSKNEMENYFNSSQIDFTEQNMETFKNLNAKVTVNSWIEDKNDAIKYQCALLFSERDRLQNAEVPDERALRKVNNQIMRLSTKHPSVVKKMSELEGEKLKKIEQRAEKFSEDKLDSEILRFFSKTTTVSYSELSSIEKRRYLEIILLSRERVKNTDDPEIKEIFTKFSNRNLEALNTEETTYLEFDENGNAVINEENFMQEIKNQYSVIKDVEITDLDELQKFSLEQAKMKFVITKMGQYARTNKDEFQKLKGKTPQEKLREIEKIRLEKSQEKEFMKSENKKREERIKAAKKQENQRNEQSSEHKSEAVIKQAEPEVKRELETEQVRKDEIKAENIKLQKVGILDRIKNFFSRIVTPKLPETTVDENIAGASSNLANNGLQVEEINMQQPEEQPKKQNIVSKILNGILGNRNNSKMPEVELVEPETRNSTAKYSDFDASLKVPGFTGSAKEVAYANRASNDLGKEVYGNQIPEGSGYGEDDGIGY